MDLSKLMFWRKNDVHEVMNVQEAGGSTSGGQITQANIQNFVVKAVGNVDNGNNDFESSEIDLTEIKNAIGTDSYIKVAVDKFAQLIFKAGYSIVSNNDAAAEYLRGRLRMMSFMTGTPMDITFQQIADDLIAYSNAFLVKSRIEMTNIGGLQAKGIYDTKPVGGYFRLDPTTVTIKRDKTGTIKGYQQEVGSNSKKYKPTDVIHFYVDKAGGAAFGTPRLASSLEDVKMLRKIEGNVLRLIYRHAMPLIQMKVGLPDPAFMATNQEITDAKKEIQKLSDDGIYITNERTSFNVIGGEGSAIDVSNYLKYFEQRVFAALSLSNAMVGRGGAKQDADSMEEQVHDTVKYFQRMVQITIENSMFTEILLEGGYNPILNEDDICHFNFNEISLETRTKMETHNLNQFQGGAITFEEMRQLNGYDTDEVDESRLFPFMVKQKNDLELVQAKMAGSAAVPEEGGDAKKAGISGPDKKTKPSGATKNTVSPQNQHGTSSMHVKEDSLNANTGANVQTFSVAEAAEDDITAKNVEHYKKNFSDVYKKYISISNDIFESRANAKAKLALGRNSIAKSLYSYIESKGIEGYRQAMYDAGVRISNKDFPTHIFVTLKEETDTRLDKIFKDIQSRLKDVKTGDEAKAVFDATAYRIRFLCEFIVGKARWYVYAKACADLGINKIYVDFGKSDDRKDHKKVVNTKAFGLDDIPPYHAYCSCKLGTEKQ